MQKRSRSTDARSEHRAVMVRGLSIGLATGAYGLSFGAIAVASGLTVGQAVALSLALFSGGSQFAFSGVVGAGGNPFAAVATSTLLALRNTIYGVQMAPLVGRTGFHRILAAHLTIDESTATALSYRDPGLARRGFWATGLSVFILWNVATVLGALGGNLLGDPREIGLDAAAMCAFLALLWPRLVRREVVGIAVVAAAFAILLVPFVPPGVPIIASVLIALGAGWRAPRAGSPAGART